MASVLRRHEAHPRGAHLRGCGIGSGFLSGIMSTLKPLARRGLEEAARKALEKAPEAAGKIVEGLGEKAKKALSGKGRGALVQKGETLEDVFKTSDGGGNTLALQALGEPVRGVRFAKPPKRSATTKETAKKDTKKAVGALSALAERL